MILGSKILIADISQTVRVALVNLKEFTAQSGLLSVVRLRAWKLALAGPSVYWYFPIFYALLTGHPRVSPVGLVALLAVLMVSASWGFLLNDLFDREADSKSGRADVIHGHTLKKSTMQLLIISTAIISWIVVFLIGGGYIFKIILAIDYLIATLYSLPPIKLKIRRFWGFLANSLMERPLPILVFLSYMDYYNVYTLLLPILMELSWSVFKHQTADVRQDINAGVTTFAAYLGEVLSNKIVNLFLNPLSVISLLFLTFLGILNIPELRPLLEISFAVTLVGVLLSFFAERKGVMTTYITPTDPPYIMFLNLSYKFMLVPIMAYGVMTLTPTYYLIIVFLLGTLSYHAYAYFKFAKKMLR